jgi:ribosome biogenesis protein ERB1
MEYHDKGLTSSEFHGNYPLMGTASHDGTIHMFHFKVENDMFSDAVVLPLKVLKGHQVKGVHGINNIKFHPKQPWVFSTGSDHKVFMWT